MSDRRKITGRLGYNQENGRYDLLVTDLWEKEGFHCEDGLEVMVNVSCVRNVFIPVICHFGYRDCFVKDFRK